MEIMNFPQATARDWRAQVDKELAGAPFEKVLVHRTAEGLSIQPLYTERPAGEPIGVDAPGAPFRLCVKVDPGAQAGAIAEEVEGGADALWLEPDPAGAVLARVDLGRTFVVLECGALAPPAALDRFAAWLPAGAAFALDADPLGDVARGRLAPSDIAGARAALAVASRVAESRWPRASVVVASTLPYHDAGADAADEIAIGLATATAYLESLIEGGLSPVAAARHIVLRVAAGRDAFGEMGKLRALRLVWRKVLAASGAADAPRARIHAVCSSRTLAQRDPWVNMLRVTTQVFAAALGGADLVTPAAFDVALGPASALGRRVARNTALVLRDESSLGRVQDPAGGAYYFDSLTDALAREAWKRFQAIEREGGIVEASSAGACAAGSTRHGPSGPTSSRSARRRSSASPSSPTSTRSSRDRRMRTRRRRVLRFRRAGTRRRSRTCGCAPTRARRGRRRSWSRSVPSRSHARASGSPATSSARGASACARRPSTRRPRSRASAGATSATPRRQRAARARSRRPGAAACSSRGGRAPSSLRFAKPASTASSMPAATRSRC